jgi:hypothetical protein
MKDNQANLYRTSHSILDEHAYTDTDTDKDKD